MNKVLTWLAFVVLHAAVWTLLAWWWSGWRGVEFFEWWALFLALNRFTSYATEKVMEV